MMHHKHPEDSPEFYQRANGSEVPRRTVSGSLEALRRASRELDRRDFAPKYVPRFNDTTLYAETLRRDSR